MLQAIFNEQTTDIAIRGDFFELDRIYFMIERLSGNLGIDRSCLLPGYEHAAFLLQALNYEIRHAQRGDREIYVQYNGLNDSWLAPAGTPASQIVKEEDTHDPEEIINDIEDAIMLDLDMDLDDFYDMEEDEQRSALEELYLDPDEEDAFFSWLYKDPTYYFRLVDYPGASQKNTLIQFSLPFSEAALYAFILRDILSQKETFIQASFQQADEIENNGSGYEHFFCQRRLRPELALTELLTEEMLSALAAAVGDTHFDELQKCLPPAGAFQGMTEQNVLAMEQLIIHLHTANPEDRLQAIRKLRI